MMPRWSSCGMTRMTSVCLLVLLVLCIVLDLVLSACVELNDCSGHGSCTTDSTCLCNEGWGSPSDVAYYKAPDCSMRVCASGVTWGSLASSSTSAHVIAECSGNGECDRVTGECSCIAGFIGKACERRGCLNDCSGHGICKSIRRMATTHAAAPLDYNTRYGVSEAAWDADIIYGCVCDSSWKVGFGAGEVQESEWFGPDCSMRHCPRGNNPRTTENELDCYGKASATGHTKVGARGNICQVDCSNAGICDYTTGLCKCFQGNYGINCGSWDPSIPPDNYYLQYSDEVTDDYYL